MPAGSVREAIPHAYQRFMKAFVQGDTVAVSESFTSDGQVLPPQGEPVVGRTAIAAFWQAAIDMGIGAIALETVEVFEHGDSASEIGRYSLASVDGQPIDRGKYIVIWQMEAGEWKLHRDIWNTSVAPPA